MLTFYTKKSVFFSSVMPTYEFFLANVKQVLTILTSVVLFKLTITGMNAVGIVLTLTGGVWYAVLDLQERAGTVLFFSS